MNRRNFVKNSFLAAIATALSGPLKLAAEASGVGDAALAINMDTSMLRNGDIIITNGIIPGTYENIKFLITKNKTEVIAHRMDNLNIKIKINSIEVVSQGKKEKPEDWSDDEFSYYEDSAPPLLQMEDISNAPVVVVSQAFCEGDNIINK
mgnify:CR=1 FL=1